MIAVDTSVTVAAFATWHEGHRKTRAAMNRDPRLPAHVALETYSVLTRLPPPRRVRPRVVHGFLTEQFPKPMLTLSPKAHRDLIARLASMSLGGGAVYDAVVAATALEAKTTLVTRDRRAVPIYQLIGVDFDLIE